MSIKIFYKLKWVMLFVFIVHFPRLVFSQNNYPSLAYEVEQFKKIFEKRTLPDSLRKTKTSEFVFLELSVVDNKITSLNVWDRGSDILRNYYNSLSLTAFENWKPTLIGTRTLLIPVYLIVSDNAINLNEYPELNILRHRYSDNLLNDKVIVTSLLVKSDFTIEYIQKRKSFGRNPLNNQGDN